MKTFVINQRDNTRTPFLRGILIRNLIAAGLPFEEAYDLANQVREELTEIDEISIADLNQLVTAQLDARYNEEIRAQYRSHLAAPSKIKVVGQTGKESAFSRNELQRSLSSSALRPEDAEQITTRIYNQLLTAGINQISTNQLGYLTFVCLQQEMGKAAAKQYLVWSEFTRSGRPLLLLICGAVGSGKSSMATEIGHRLDIVRMQSTDMLREVMRSVIPRKLLPVLHCSSFDAWKKLPIEDKQGRDQDMLIAEGYRSQSNLLALACESVMRRAIRESTSLILEGVHAHPDLLDRVPADTGVVMVHITLAVMDEKELKTRLQGRGASQPQRRGKRYLKKFDSIWRLQNFVLSEAERCDTPVIPNDEREAAIFQLISTINQELSRQFRGSPGEVFGREFDRIRRQSAGKTWQQQLPLLVPAKSAPASTKPAKHG